MSYRERLRENWIRRHRAHAREGAGGSLRHRMLFSADDSAGKQKLKPRQRLMRELFERVLRDVEFEGSFGFEEHADARIRLRGLIEQGLHHAELTSLNDAERLIIERALIAELSGYGPLDPLVSDPTVSDILVNGPFEVWVDRFGRLEKTDICFEDEEHLRRVLERMVGAHGRHLEEANPYVDARLPDGSRLHAMIPPLSSVGPVFAIRRSRSIPLRLDELYAAGTLSPAMGQFLSASVQAGMSIVVSGGASTGKTTLLNVLSQFIPSRERVITIEETAELRFEHPHVVSLEARQPNIEGRGEVNLRTLVRNALRLRADRIIVGEVRGGEVFDMLQAMNVGHSGSMTTVHANGPDDALRRLETLVLVAGIELPSRAIRELLGAAFNMIVQTTRFPDGSRRITSIREVLAGEGTVSTRELFRFEAARTGAAGAARYRATGVLPTFISRLQAWLPGAEALFDAGTGYDVPEHVHAPWMVPDPAGSGET